MYGTTILVSLTLMASVSSVPWRECADIVEEAGLNRWNCSGADLIHLPKNLPEKAEVLDFSHNRFTVLPFIPESKECLEEAHCQVINSTNHCRLDISFSWNEIHEFHDQVLHGLRCLRSLDLSHNEITADILHTHLFQEGAHHLLKLDLHSNPLGTLPDNIITEPYMPALRELDLSQCQLADIGKNSVDDFRELRLLNLSYNSLKTIQPQTFKGLAKLQNLDLRHNELVFFANDVFADLTGLEMLYLADNKITGFDSKAFYNDSNLIVLALQNNQLSSIPYTALGKLPKLHTLDLSQNPIQLVHRVSSESSVKNLVLDRIPTIQEIGPEALESFPALVSLSVSNNKDLKVIHSGFLGGSFKAIRHVRLENNGLYTLPSDALPWRQLEDLKLDGNSFVCDDKVEWIIHAACIKDPVICVEPMKLRGHDLKTINPNDLRRFYNIQPATVIILFSILLPTFGVCAVLVWKRRHHFTCANTKVRGRYVSVYTRDVDDDGEERVAIELKLNVNRLAAISNDDIDDTKPFIKVHEKEHEVDEEEI